MFHHGVSFTYHTQRVVLPRSTWFSTHSWSEPQPARSLHAVSPHSPPGTRERKRLRAVPPVNSGEYRTCSITLFPLRTTWKG